MKSSHRTALSLLLTIVIFTVISLAAVFGGFKYVEMHYYQPRVVNNVAKTLDAIGSSYDSYTDALVTAFSAYAMDERTRTFIEREVTQTDIEQRELMTNQLMERTPDLEGIRLVESDGVHVHYSTFASDIFSKSDELISYRNYDELNELPIQFLASADNGEYTKNVQEISARCGIYLDSEKERLVFSLPYFDKYTAHRGTLLYYVGSGEFVSKIISDNIVPLNTRLKIVAPVDQEINTQNFDNSGFVFGMPNVGRDIITQSVTKTWSAKRYGAEQLVQTENGEILILVTGVNCKYGKIGWICRDSEFSFSETEKVLLLLCLFVTLFLIIFMIFNFRHDDSVIIRERVHKFEMALFREYLEHRDTDDWKALEKNISLRKQDVNAEIVKSLGITGKKHSKEITEALDRSWNDFMHLMSGGYRATLENLTSQPSAHQSSAVTPIAVQPLTQIQNGEELEEISVVEDAEPVEELEEIPLIEEAQPLDGEPVEELEEIPEAEPLDEDLVEELEEAEPIEELEEIPADEKTEAAAELEDLDELEPASKKQIHSPKENSSGAMKTEQTKTDDIKGDKNLDDDIDVPVVEDFVDPLDEEDLMEEETVADELVEISPEEEAQIAQIEAQEKKKSYSWAKDFLSEDDIGTPSFKDLDEENDSFWDETPQN